MKSRLYYEYAVKEVLTGIVNVSAILILLGQLAIGVYALTVDLRTGAIIIVAVLVVMLSGLLIAYSAMQWEAEYWAEAQDHQEAKLLQSTEDDDVFSIRPPETRFDPRLLEAEEEERDEDKHPGTKKEPDTTLTPAEQMEVTKLSLRLHRLFPNRNYLRGAIEGFPRNAGRGELRMLRAEVDYEEHCDAERVLMEYKQGHYSL